MSLLKKLFEPVDMTEGSPWQKIVLFTVPMLVGNIAQQLYNTVDSVVVGNYVGDNALAAVGSAGPILNLLIVLFVGISVGAGIMVSQYFGARQKENLKLHYADGDCDSVCDGGRFSCGKTASGAVRDARIHYRLVPFLFTDIVYRFGGTCLLQYSERNFKRAWGLHGGSYLSAGIDGN